MSKQSDLATGGVLQKQVFVALPVMGAQLMQMLYNLTDMFWLGAAVVGCSGSLPS